MSGNGLLTRVNQIKTARLAAAMILALLGILSVNSNAQTSSTAPTPKPTLSADQQKKLATLRAAFGHDTVLDQLVTNALGITKGKEVLTLRQLTVDKHPIMHSYIPLPDGGYLLVLADLDAAYSYRLDAHLKLVTAVRAAGNGPVAIPVPDAERNAEVELVFWAALADRH